MNGTFRINEICRHYESDTVFLIYNLGYHLFSPVLQKTHVQRNAMLEDNKYFEF